MNKWLNLAGLAVVAFATFAINTSPVNAQNPPEHCLRAPLSGAPLNGVQPSGLAQHCMQFDPETGIERQFEVDVHRVKLPNGAILSVYLNGGYVGKLRLREWEGSLNLDTQLGNRVPSVHKGDKVTVATSTGALVVSGAF